jgi:hypothetical protein
MPVLVLSVAEDLHELLENGRLAAITALCELCRVVVVAIDIAVVLIVAILSAEDGRAKGACEVVYMVFAIESGYVGSSKGTPTLIAQQTKSSEVVRLAQRILTAVLFVISREEFRGNDLATVLRRRRKC